MNEKIFFPVLETLSLSEKIPIGTFLCTEDFEFERKIFSLYYCTRVLSLGEKIPIGVFPCTGDFEFERQNPYRDFPCTGDFEFLNLLRAP